MTTLRLVLMIVVPCVVTACLRAVDDENPRKTKGTETETETKKQLKQAAQNKEFQELEKRIHDEFLKKDHLYRQMVKANPHDIRAWRLLGWNEAYNLSVTSDDVVERYAHVKQGIEHLLEGVGYNPTDARLYHDVAHSLQHRIGRGDERRLFRTLFRNDEEFHKLLAGHVDQERVAGPDGLPDVFLVARRWYEETIAMIEKHGSPAGLPNLVNPLVLNSGPAMCQTAHAIAVEDDGHFDEVAVNAWKQAWKMWDALGEQEFVSKDGAKYRLKDNEAARMVVNYDYWRRRCQVEQTELVLNARRAIYRAVEYQSRFKGMGRWAWDENMARQRADFTDEARGQAKQFFDQAFRTWAAVYKEHAWLVDNETELGTVIRQYQRCILNGKPLPDDFPLRHIPSLLPPSS